MTWSYISIERLYVHESIADAFVDRFAIAGPPAHCVKRFEELLKLSLDHLIVVGPGADVGPSDQVQALGLFTREVLPVLRSGRQIV